jgi:hypothetical protein
MRHFPQNISSTIAGGYAKQVAGSVVHESFFNMGIKVICDPIG